METNYAMEGAGVPRENIKTIVNYADREAELPEGIQNLGELIENSERDLVLGWCHSACSGDLPSAWKEAIEADIREVQNTFPGNDN